MRHLARLSLLCLAAFLPSADAAAKTLLFAAHGAAEPPFAEDAGRCGAGSGHVGYLGGQAVCADLLLGRLDEGARAALAAASELVLLTSQPGQRTFYRAQPDEGPLLLLEDLAREAQSLTIRGQLDAAGQPLIWLRGRALVDTLCDPRRVADEAACRAGLPTPVAAEEPWAGRYELSSLALVEEAAAVRTAGGDAVPYDGVTEGGPQAPCIVLRRVSGIVLTELGFEDCWLVAVLAVDAQAVTLSRSRLHGSTFGLLAVATTGQTPAVHDFVVTGNHWIQTPAGYRTDAEPCASPHLDLGCAVDLWDELPWGVVHHHLWRPLNGALFAGYDIAGNVLFADNLVERAFNGIRLWSQVPGSGRNVEVRGNVFRFVRDNPIEPEGRAEGWIVKHNVFENAHAWISTDGVAGGWLFVFGNRGWHDPGEIPGGRCRADVDWALSPQFRGLAGDAGRWQAVDESGDPGAVECQGHLRGVVLKTGDDNRRGFPYLAGIAVFNNSWTTRWPLFSSKHASPLVHFNNLVAFAGCGLDGPLHCRQIPFPASFCGPGDAKTRGGASLRQFWTDDRSTLVADCFTLTPGPAEPDAKAAESRAAAHLFCRDAFNRSFADFPYAADICAPLFLGDEPFAADGEAPRLRSSIAGCRPRLMDESVLPDCSGAGPAVGALDQDGRLFDMDIPGAGYLGQAFRP